MRVSISLPDELGACVDGVRGDVPRSVWVRRAVERALESSQGAPGLRGNARLPRPGDLSPAPAEWPPAGSLLDVRQKAERERRDSGRSLSRSETFKRATQR